MTELLDLSGRPEKVGGPTLAQVRAVAQREADANGVDIAIGWEVNDEGEKELGFCQAAIAPHSAFVVEVLEVARPVGRKARWRK